MKTTLLMLSCDRIESAKFIHDTLSLYKLVYYNFYVFSKYDVDFGFYSVS